MNNDKVTQYLKTVEKVIAQGPYRDNWESLSDYPVATWYQQAKFGIFIHWGVYSVPAFGNEWYPRNMYVKGTKEYEHHIKTYGPHSKFGYKDFIPLFKGEKFDASEWVSLFTQAGARFIMPVAEHHDGFQMYASELSHWNAAEMGPKRNVLGELKKEVEAAGMKFCVSNHRAENYWYFGGGREYPSDLISSEYQEPYGWAKDGYNHTEQTLSHDIGSMPASKEHLDDWLVRNCELVDKYQPKVVWFDWWIQNLSFKPYLKKFAAYYYNRAKEWGEEVAINYKYDAFMYSSAVFDIERGQLKDIRPRLWQNDTAIAKNSWGYTENNDFKNPVDLVCDLVDIVSKNGALLLNVGPRADGSITEEDRDVLVKIGGWLKVNGEAIYGTGYWTTFGEGDTIVPEGAFTDVDRSPFTSRDIRFTFKAPCLYATVMHWPADGKVAITSLKKMGKNFRGLIKNVELIGFRNELKFTRDDEALHVAVTGKLETAYPVCLKITLE